MRRKRPKPLHVGNAAAASHASRHGRVHGQSRQGQGSRHPARRASRRYAAARARQAAAARHHGRLVDARQDEGRDGRRASRHGHRHAARRRHEAQARVPRAARGRDRERRVLHGDGQRRSQRSVVHARQRGALPRPARDVAGREAGTPLRRPAGAAAPPPPVAKKAAAPPPSVMQVEEGRSDPELVEVFIEEAKEEIASIQRNLPLWAADRANSEALITTRRSFHTLKGSGRMVGAQLIGEFAWNIENLLNRAHQPDARADAEHDHVHHGSERRRCRSCSSSSRSVGRRRSTCSC